MRVCVFSGLGRGACIGLDAGTPARPMRAFGGGGGHVGAIQPDFSGGGFEVDSADDEGEALVQPLDYGRVALSRGLPCF